MSRRRHGRAQREESPIPIRHANFAGAREAARRARRAAALALAAAWLLAAPALAADYEDGLSAFQAGDYDKAERIWRELAGQGDPAAQYGLGVLYEKGAGPVQQDDAQAVRWYEQAAQQDVAAAQNNLALMYAQGRGVQKDPGRAAELWRRAAQRGHARAQYNLGLAYYRGEGVGKSIETALRWFRRAAGAGLADAQYGLGQMYRLGVGVDEDAGTALAWYRKAAAQGHAEADEEARSLSDEGVEAKPLEMAGDGEAGQAAEAPGSGMPEAEPSTEAEPETAEPAEAMTEPAAEVEPAMEEEPAPESQAGATQTAAAPATSAPEDRAHGVHVWLGSAEDRAGAERRRAALTGEGGGALNGVDLRVQRVRHAGGRTVYRVLGGPMDSPEAARAVCDTLRRAAPDTFCKVLDLRG